MKVQVYLSKGDAVRLGSEQSGELQIEVDISQLSQDERDILASSQERWDRLGQDGLRLNHKYTGQDSTEHRLFPPTPEGVRELLAFAVANLAEERTRYEEQVKARRVLEEREKQERQEKRDRAIAYLLTLDEQKLFEATTWYRGTLAKHENVRLPDGGAVNWWDIQSDPRLARVVEWRQQLHDERKRLEQQWKAAQRAEEERRAAAKQQQVADWIATRGTDSQRKRAVANLLDEQEVIDAMRDEAFAPLNQYPKYARLVYDDIDHVNDYCGRKADYEAEDCNATEAMFAQMEAMQTMLPGGDVTPRRHVGTCRDCHSSVTRYSMLAQITVGAFNFTRDYAVVEPVPEPPAANVA